MSASQKFVIDRPWPQFFEVKELIAEAEVQIQEAVFFQRRGVTHWAKIDQLTPEKLAVFGDEKKFPSFCLGGFLVGEIIQTPVIPGEIWGV